LIFVKVVLESLGFLIDPGPSSSLQIRTCSQNIYNRTYLTPYTRHVDMDLWEAHSPEAMVLAEWWRCIFSQVAPAATCRTTQYLDPKITDLPHLVFSGASIAARRWKDRNVVVDELDRPSAKLSEDLGGSRSAAPIFYACDLHP
jgi:hypothetical protein